MSIYQIIVGSVLVLVLMWFGWKTLFCHGIIGLGKKNPGFGPTLPLVVRVCRLYSGASMMILGVMLLVGLMYLEVPAQGLADQSDKAVEQGVPISFTPEQKSFATTYARFWLCFLLLLFSMVVSSSIDALCSWSFTRKHRKPLFFRSGCVESRAVHVSLPEQPIRKKEYWCESFFHQN